jgi:hypothetical protein
MQTLKVILVTMVSLLFFASLSVADDEGGNRVYVTASQYGQFYAKSIPSETYGLKGITKVYQVGKDEDTLIQTYDWYSPQIFLEGFAGTQSVYVVQMGPWQRGHKASPEHHAIAFYKNDKPLRKYSTLDIVGSEDNVSSSKSHYTIFSKIQGFRQPFGDQLIFDVETHNGKIISFDAETGDILTQEEESIKKQLYDAEVKIGQLKWKWYESKKAELPSINDVVITEAMLKEIAVQDFPVLPQGYKYIPDTMWKGVRFEKTRRGD